MEAGRPVWSREGRGVEIRFVGRGPRATRAEVLRQLDGPDRQVAWLRQRHSSRCLEARGGECGEGDAVWTRGRDLVLCVASADCVPIVVARRSALAVIHAGWRGIAGGVVPAALRVLGKGARAPAAWIGPAVGPCCYEVGPEVASRVTAASSPRAALAVGRGKTHLDLIAAVAWQLEHSGVSSIERVGPCTACSPDLLWSYRRQKEAAGRNLTFAWLTG